MRGYINPFEYEAANRLTIEELLDYYIEDFNYSRFVQSRRNIFLSGERGTGKTMILRYNSFPVQTRKAERDCQDVDYEVVGVYVPCNTPLYYKEEHKALDPYRASVMSEYFLAVDMMIAVAETLRQVPQAMDDVDLPLVTRQVELNLGVSLPTGMPFFESVATVLQAESTEAQKVLNGPSPDAFYERARSFSSGVIPLLLLARRLPRLCSSHFSFLIDDAHDLNEYQAASLNSWIAYRDHSLFSFKVAVAKSGSHSFKTAAGGSILEGHDFTLVDLEQPYQSEYSLFGKLARDIISKRLDRIGLHDVSPEAFFPENPAFLREMAKCRKSVQEEAMGRFPHGSRKQIADYVYKYTRAAYFQRRSPKANRPPYAGLDILVHLSTGVVRNLLEPCYWMYDRVVSEQQKTGSDFDSQTIREVPHAIQTEEILKLSSRRWDRLREGLDRIVGGCSREQGVRIFRVFDNLAMLFRERLRRHKSEPRAIAFTISEQSHPRLEDLIELLSIARRAQFLYVYSSAAKDYGRREVYYVPNRILWPERGLDPHGQNARVSIKAGDLWAAASENRRIPLGDEGGSGGLFHDAE